MKCKLILLQIILLSATALAQGEIWIRPNQGQWHDNVSYQIDLPGGKMYLEDGGFTYGFTSNNEHYHHGHEEEEAAPTHYLTHAVKTTFIGSNPSPTYSELNPSSFYENYFIGNDPSKWVTHSNAYEKIIYHELYDYIDL